VVSNDHRRASRIIGGIADIAGKGQGIVRSLSTI
jgi:hypothetical protein